MIVSAKSPWGDAFKVHNHYLSTIIDDAIASLILHRGIRSRLANFLTLSKDAILSTSPREMTKAIHYFNNEFHNEINNLGRASNSKINAKISKNKLEKANDILQKIFDYNDFSNKNHYLTGKWCAYKLYEYCNIKFCPYCNLNSVEFVAAKSIGDAAFRGTLDHFYPKSIFPFLALSLSNLVPCCEKCNSKAFKGSLNTYRNKILNPLIHGEKLKFKIISTGIDGNNLQFDFKKPTNNFELTIVKVKDKKHRSSRSIKTFKLKELYSVDSIKESAHKFMKNHILYNDSEYVKFMAEKFHHLNIKQEIHKILYTTNYKNEYLGKMSKDIFLQVKGSN